MGKQTDDERPTSLSRRGADLFHSGRHFESLCELAVFFQEGLEFGVDMCHACKFGADQGSKIKAKIWTVDGEILKARSWGAIYSHFIRFIRMSRMSLFDDASD